MKISKRHQKLLNILKDPRVLNHPEEFLGPNWKAVLNFWIYLDTLTGEQWRVIRKRYLDVNQDEFNAAYGDAVVAAKKIISHLVDVYYASCSYSEEATLEIIGSHELLNKQKPFIFLSLFLNP